ncbi:MAG: YdcF family protein [Deltaproteobacteria bacterium]|nr:YdcF family protein [Deltaproteobacteria bacterium]
MFIIKKIVSPFLSPVTLSLLISFIGLFFLLATKKTRTGKLLVSAGLLLMLFLSYGFVSDRVIEPLEYRYKPYDMQLTNELLKSQNQFPLKYVVVLGAGHISDPSLPVTSQISDDSLIRLTEGIIIHRKNMASKLVLSGGIVFDSISDSEMMARVAEELGIDRNDIIMEAESKDTEDEVRFIKRIVKDNPFVLVTSANHMPRAMAMFQKLGLDPIPAPTRHYVKRGTGEPHDYFPWAMNLAKAEAAFHEYFGMIWAKLSGQI